jgi:hypothetical protein
MKIYILFPHKHFKPIEILPARRVSVRQQEEFDRRSLYCALAFSEGGAAGRSRKTRVARSAPVCWGLGAWSSMVGSARPLPSVSNLPPAVSKVPTGRTSRPRRLHADLRLIGPRHDGFIGSIGRGLAQQGRKRKSAARHDRHGKGGYFTAITGRHDHSTTVDADGPELNDLELVEDMLQRRFPSTLRRRLIGDDAYESALLVCRLRVDYRLQLLGSQRACR